MNKNFNRRILGAVALACGVFVIWGLGGAFVCSRLFAIDAWPHSALGWSYPIAVAAFFGVDFFMAKWPLLGIDGVTLADAEN